MAPAAARSKIAGHLQVRGEANGRRYFASWWDETGARRTTKLGPAHVRDSGRRTPRGAIIWRTAPGPCPPGHLTPAMAEEALEALLDGARVALASMAVEAELEPDGPTFGDAVDAWLEYLEVEKRREYGTLRDARNVAKAEFLPWFGRDTPLTTMVREEAVLQRGGRRFTEVQAERRDTFTTDDIDAKATRAPSSRASSASSAIAGVRCPGGHGPGAVRQMIAPRGVRRPLSLTCAGPSLVVRRAPVSSHQLAK